MKRFLRASWIAMLCLGGGMAAQCVARAADGPTLFDPASPRAAESQPQPIEHLAATTDNSDSEITIRPSRVAPSNRRGAEAVRNSGAKSVNAPAASITTSAPARRIASPAAASSLSRRVVAQSAKRPATIQRVSGEVVSVRSLAPQAISPTPVAIDSSNWRSLPVSGVNASYGQAYYGDATWNGSAYPVSVPTPYVGGQYHSVSYGIPSPVIVPLATAGYGQCPPWRPCGPGNSLGGNRGIRQGFYGADFRPACAQHDACLAGNCNRRIDCDREFLANMCAACELSDRPALCRAKARQYYAAARLFGGFYR